MKTNTAGQVTATKSEICALLRAFVNQRPGLDFANYGCATSYRSELRGITRQRADALQLLRAVELRDSINAQDLIEAFPRAFSGRLELTESKGKPALFYCAGQYYATEYRAAVCAVLSSVLWAYFRANMPTPAGILDGSPIYHGSKPGRGNTAGQWLRRKARAEFGRGIASRWFN
jgi:hypothetical protein